MKKMKKGIACLLAGLLALTSVPAAAVEVQDADYDYEALKGQNISINVYNWGEYISDGSDGGVNVNEEFEKLTGIKVNYTNFATNEELYAKLKSGGTDYDVIIPSDYMAGRMIEEDMLEKIDFANVPNFEYTNEQFRNLEYDPTNEYTVPYTWGIVGLIYNTTMVDKTIDSWDALWDEDYKNNVLMFSNSRDAFAISLARLGYSLNTTDESELEQAAEELKKQKSLGTVYVMDEIFDKMEGGEAAIAPYYAGDAITMIEENPDLAFAVPKEGTNRFVDVMCIPKGSKNKQAAEMYINFMCDPEIAKDNCEFIGYSTTNTAAYELLDDEMKNSEIAYPSDEVLENTEVFLNLNEETNKKIDALWTEVISSSNQQTTASGTDSADGSASNSSSSSWWILVVVGAVIVAGAAFLFVRNKKNKIDY